MSTILELHGSATVDAHQSDAPRSNASPAKTACTLTQIGAANPIATSSRTLVAIVCPLYASDRDSNLGVTRAAALMRIKAQLEVRATLVQLSGVDMMEMMMQMMMNREAARTPAGK